MDHGILGHKIAAPDNYAPEVLFAIPRALGRTGLPISQDGALPFYGVDVWNAYELCWRNAHGVPQLAVATLTLPITSPNLVESKSLKLYLGSLWRKKFATPQEVMACIAQDVSACVGEKIDVSVTLPAQFFTRIGSFSGTCIDDSPLSGEPDASEPDADLLQAGTGAAADAPPQQLFSRLLRSLCPVTSQPDWADLQVVLHGARVQPASLLRYILSFASHNGFHEQCVERIYCDLQQKLRPTRLTVDARYTRRGGIDINPFRASHREHTPEILRTFRQ